MQGGGTFGIDGVTEAVADADYPTAASHRDGDSAGRDRCWREPLEDDATVVVMAID